MEDDLRADIDDGELLQAVESGEMELPDGFPEAIVARRPALLVPLCEIAIDPDNWRGFNDVHDGWSPIHAMHLLGGIGDPAATEALLEPLRDTDWDEYFLDDGPGIFAHLGPGAVPAMERSARREEGDDSAVGVVLDGLQGLGILYPEHAEVGRSVVRSLVMGARDEDKWLPPLYVNYLAEPRNPEDLQLLRETYEADA